MQGTGSYPDSEILWILVRVCFKMSCTDLYLHCIERTSSNGQDFVKRNMYLYLGGKGSVNSVVVFVA